jgi:hypothetical protein
MRTSTHTPDGALLLLGLQILVALLDEEFAFEELETFVDDAGNC